MQGPINFHELSQVLDKFIHPAVAELNGLGIQVVDYTFRRHTMKEHTSNLHIFHLKFDDSLPYDFVKTSFEDKFKSTWAQVYTQVDFNSVPGCATALIMF